MDDLGVGGGDDGGGGEYHCCLLFCKYTNNLGEQAATMIDLC